MQGRAYATAEWSSWLGLKHGYALDRNQVQGLSPLTLQLLLTLTREATQGPVAVMIRSDVQA